MTYVKPDYKLVRDGYASVIRGLGLSLDDEHLAGTPDRAARALLYDLCDGVYNKAPDITTFAADGDAMIVLQGIPVFSLCAHHLLPFMGTAVVGYIPGRKRIIGISKLHRLVDYWARRPQVQERLTDHIADALVPLTVVSGGTGPSVGGVGVLIRARHMCMEMRDMPARDMVTSAVRGLFREEQEVRHEFLQFARQ